MIRRVSSRFRLGRGSEFFVPRIHVAARSGSCLDGQSVCLNVGVTGLICSGRAAIIPDCPFATSNANDEPGYQSRHPGLWALPRVDYASSGSLPSDARLKGNIEVADTGARGGVVGHAGTPAPRCCGCGRARCSDGRRPDRCQRVRSILRLSRSCSISSTRRRSTRSCARTRVWRRDLLPLHQLIAS